ncbi:MAG TPA: hypothetical protein VH255_09700, partial [Verrucomicrobiae bacterium]|nr:hypothetical protein [Verrucomicrobiae bacterium]
MKRAVEGRETRVEGRKCFLPSAFSPRPSALDPRLSERGMALVITLILLSVTLVMALAFLAISTRERTAVTTSTETATARLAADSALANAEAQIAANILATSNSYNYGLLVSTNYINPNGFDPALVGVNLTNVNYDYLAGGGTLNSAQFEQNVANLSYSPRAPVFITDPATGTNDFRFYLDLNRNGMFDANGVADAGVPGDPEWIGVLEHPDAPHGPNNHFIARYLFWAQPAGNTMDLNYIHNLALIPPENYIMNPMNSGNDGYFRNQGVGSWEINLAAFLNDLNTNVWSSYGYNGTNTGFANTGFAFADAFALLTNRYAGNYNSLAPVGGTIPAGLFTNSSVFPPFQNNIDLYGAGPLMTNTAGINEGGQNVTLPWVGADNTNHFFDLSSDLFDPAKSSGGATGGFTNRLLNAGSGTNNYDRYTFYRLLDQLGTDSTPESGKMNLNYDNLDSNGNVVAGAETNFFAWDATKFFTNAADRMLKLYTANWLAADYNSYTNTFGVTEPFGLTTSAGVTNIPVFVGGRFVYSSAVQRILQLAANIYDATTTNFYPSVFRPLFTQTSGDIYITGYTNIQSVIGVNDPAFSIPLEASPTNGIGLNVPVNIYGVPWIIGAKKGLPNFNKVSMETSVQMTRKLQVTRTQTTGVSRTGGPLFQYGTNQMYIMSISNFVGVGCWNSYNTPYPKTGIAPVQIALLDNLAMQLTNNQVGFSGISFNTTYFNNPNPFIISGWPASSDPNSFLAPLNTNAVLLANSVYNYGPATIPGYSAPGFIPQPAISPDNYLNVGTPQLPQFILQITNRLRLVMLDSNHIIDYVQLNGMDDGTNLNQILADPDFVSGIGSYWSTNTQDNSPTGVPYGIINQMATSSTGGSAPVGEGSWAPVPGFPASQVAEQSYFSAFLLGNTTFSYNGKTYSISAPNTQAPFTPTRTRVFRYTWQANDPLVHYLASD